jgi:hypothetical protein
MAENKPIYFFMKELCILLNSEYYIYRKHDIHQSILGGTQVCTVKLAIAIAYVTGQDLHERKAIWRFVIK